jgi:hypothetical protein
MRSATLWFPSRISYKIESASCAKFRVEGGIEGGERILPGDLKLSMPRIDSISTFFTDIPTGQKIRLKNWRLRVSIREGLENSWERRERA